MGEGGGEEVVDWLAELLSEGNVGDCGRELPFKRPVEFGREDEVGEARWQVLV